MRRLLAILLLTVFSVPYASVFFASDASEASLPICCRKDGKHHCSMMSASREGNSINIISEKCPYTPAAPAALHLLSYTPPVGASVFAELVRHPAVHAQTHAKYRISSDRSRQKRGPPSLILL